MKLHDFRLFLGLFFSLVFTAGLSARDLSSWKAIRDSIYQNQTSALASTPDLINWPTYIGFQQTGKINASFNSFGQFGFIFAPEYPYAWLGGGYVPSFVTPVDSGAEYLYVGAIWIGGILGDDTLVSTGAEGWQQIYEFYPPNFGSAKAKGTTDKVDYVADFSMRSEFTDTTKSVSSFAWPNPTHKPLNLKITNRSHAWHNSPQNETIIYDMVVTNIGNEEIRDGCVGFYFDCDVGIVETYDNWLDDLAGSLHSHGIGYVIDNNGDLDTAFIPASQIFAFKFLNNSFNGVDTSFNWWKVDEPGLNFGPRQRGTLEHPFRNFSNGEFGYPETDPDKYYVMHFPEWDYDQIQTYSIRSNDPIWLEPDSSIDADLSDGSDARFLMSIGSFQLPPDSSVRILYTTFTGDFVHTTGASSHYLPEDPDTYYSLLYFNDVIANAGRADSLAEVLLNSNLPPLGLQVIKKPDGSHELQWDPWVYDDVVGYHLFISEANLDTLPYPGVVPPWWRANTSEIPVISGKTYRMNIDYLDPDKHYVASIAHDLGSGIGEISVPIQFKFNPRKCAPPLPARHAFANPGRPLALKWNHPTGKSATDHFNIYKFENKIAAQKAYHAKYDEGYFSQLFQPRDSFEIGNKTYYFYAMEPYAVAGANDTIFFDADVTEGEAYIIASADQYGFESEFTEPILANVVDEMTRDILLITNSAVVTPNNFTFIDSVYSFYNRILFGYDYEIYIHRDSTNLTNCPNQNVSCMDWHDFMKFKMVIVDDHLSEAFFSSMYQDSSDGFVRYLEHGGKLAYFGRFRGFGFNYTNGTMLNYFPVENEFVSYYLGIDSLLFGGERYYFNYTTPPYFDTLFGFIGGVQVGGILPSLDVDTLRDPFTPRLRNYWTTKTPPGVATFKINSFADTSLLFNSIYPLKSLQQDHVVGVRRDFPGLNTYACTFGFHLWYMDSTDAGKLIKSIFNDEASSLFGQALVEPSEFFSLNFQSSDSPFAYIHVGNLANNRSVSDIDLSSLLINNTIIPASAEIILSYQGFDGEVLKIEISTEDLLNSYSADWDTLFSSFTVDGLLVDSLSFHAAGPIIIIGRLRGDINEDAAVTVIDLTIIVDYIFRGLPLSGSRAAADVDANGKVNILDLTKIVDFLFRGGDL